MARHKKQHTDKEPLNSWPSQENDIFKTYFPNIAAENANKRINWGVKLTDNDGGTESEMLAGQSKHDDGGSDPDWL
jgi:hypothetical protein